MFMYAVKTTTGEAIDKQSKQENNIIQWNI